MTGIDDCIPTVTPVDSGTLLLGSSTACSIGGSTCIVPETSTGAGKDDYVYDTYLLERYDLLDADATIDQLYMSAYVHDLTEVRGGRRAVGVL